MPDGREGNFLEIVNDSVNMTLTRSINTNLTTFASILMLYILGVASIKEFTLPMMVGIIAGACSSVFLTGPLWHFMRSHFGPDAKDYRAFLEKEEKKMKAAASTERTVQDDGTVVEIRKSNNPNVIRKKKKKS